MRISISPLFGSTELDCSTLMLPVNLAPSSTWLQQRTKHLSKVKQGIQTHELFVYIFDDPNGAFT